MTAPPPRRVTCPQCLDEFLWDESEPLEYSITDGKYNRAKKPVGRSRIEQARRWWYVQCPNPSRDTGNHYLPVTLVDYPDPLVIALVGRPRSGKTHLVVAMIRELLTGVLVGEHTLHGMPLDPYLHNTFKRRYLEPFEFGEVLPASPSKVDTYLEWLVVRHGDIHRSLVFFDVAGENFRDTTENGRYARFLENAGAVLFVEDAPWVFRDVVEDRDIQLDNPLASQVIPTNEWVLAALDRIPAARRESLPAVVALTKSDRLRYLSPADRWIREGGGSGLLSAERMLAETRDVYAMLNGSKGKSSMIRIFSEFRRCTMHFVSATGGAALTDELKYPAGTRPQRVLVPLFALFAMAGLIAGPEAGRVGR